MKRKNINTIIFDFDGTLADTLPLCYYSLQTVFKTFDFKCFSDNQIKEMFGPTEPNIINKYLVHNNKHEAIELYFTTYLEKHDESVIPNPEITSMLNILKENGYKLGIVTGKSSKSLEISLKFLEIEKLFDCKITGDDVTKPKPDPEGINKLLTILNINNGEAIFLGDSDADVLAGQKANVYTIGVQWLPNIQTSQFSIPPDDILKDINGFMKYFLPRL